MGFRQIGFRAIFAAAPRPRADLVSTGAPHLANLIRFWVSPPRKRPMSLHKHSHPVCGATNRKGEPCRKPVVDGHWRCKHHGGLSTGPRKRFAVTEAQVAEEAERKAKITRRLYEGRMHWIADRKARGEKIPWGRKPKGFDYEQFWLDRCDYERAKADAKRIEAPYRRWRRDYALEAERQALLERQRARAAAQRAYDDDPTKRDDETWEENAMRYACIMERRRREQRLLL